MSIEAEKSILKDGMNELNDRGKISNTTKEIMDEYIDSLSDYNIYEIKYSDFDQTNSTGVVFNNSSRTVTFDSGSALLLTNIINLTNIKIKDFKLKGTDENVLWEITYNKTIYYGIDSYDVNETVTNPYFYLRIGFDASNTIKGLYIIYENI